MLSYKTIIAIEVLRLLRKDGGNGMFIAGIKQSLGLRPRNRQVTEYRTSAQKSPLGGYGQPEPVAVYGCGGQCDALRSGDGHRR